MYTDSYKYLSEIMQKSFSSISSTYLESTQKSFETLIESAKYLAQVTLSGYSVENLRNLLSYLSDLCKDSVSNIPEVKNDSFDFLSNVVVQDEHVELTEADCDSINTLLSSSIASKDVPAKVSKGKIKVVDFIKTVIIPILALLLPMMQNSFYNKQASLESQKTQIQEQEYQAQVLQTMSDMVNALESIQESLNSRSVSGSDPEENRYYFDDIQQTLDKVQDIVSELRNTDSTVSDMPASSESATHKE